mgnify:CR=1 FL=1
MKQIKAKIVDVTHLELSQPISGKAGEIVFISVPDESDEPEDHFLWMEASKKKLLSAYGEEDSVYDDL